MNVTETPTIETTVGELVAQRPSRSRVFEKLGIDYCCGGNRPLSEACAAKGLDADTILTTLLAAEGSSSSNEPNWANARLSDLADHIEQTHHAYLKRELPRLRGIVRKVATVHGGHHPWMHELDGIYDRFAAEMEAHMMKEEQVLFPQIRSLERGEPGPAGRCGAGVENPIGVMPSTTMPHKAWRACASFRADTPRRPMPATRSTPCSTVCASWNSTPIAMSTKRITSCFRKLSI